MRSIRRGDDPDAVARLLATLLPDAARHAGSSKSELLVYARTSSERRVIVVLNFTSQVQELVVGPDHASALVLLGSHRRPGEQIAVGPLRLQPLESVILQP
jgi:hypothetical protein